MESVRLTLWESTTAATCKMLEWHVKVRKANVQSTLLLEVLKGLEGVLEWDTYVQVRGGRNSNVQVRGGEGFKFKSEGEGRGSNA